MPSCTIDGIQPFVLIIGGQIDSSVSYNYSLIPAPIINSISPQSFNPTKKAILLIMGSGFGNDKNAASVHLSN